MSLWFYRRKPNGKLHMDAFSAYPIFFAWGVLVIVVMLIIKSICQ